MTDGIIEINVRVDQPTRRVFTFGRAASDKNVLEQA
jgi:hypothetical protein